MRLVWRGSVIVALLLVALGISWLPWRELIKLDSSRASEPTRPPAVIDSTAAPDDAPPSATPVPSASAPGKTKPVEPPTAADKAALAKVVTLVNAERKRKGCGAVKVDARLAKAATDHSADMARRSYFSHNTPEGVDPWQRAGKAGYTRPTGENIALGYADAKTVMDGWMKSAGHRENILDCAAHSIGVGLARNADGTLYWTQVFGAA
jgi:uncharacterized protein YkwD